jgi:gliding motility-associatede transport system auxiliary component
MATEIKSRSSFSPGRKWKVGFDLLLRTVFVVAVVAMINYLSARAPHRFYLSSQTHIALSSNTVSVLRSLTNNVTVTLYYDHKDDFYQDVVTLLNEYSAVDSKITIRTVDYLSDPGEAERIKEQYRKYFTSAGDKNLIIFDANGRVKIARGEALVKYAATGITKDQKLQIGPVALIAEQAFTSILMTLESDKQFKAYFLQGHHEPPPDDLTSDAGYAKFIAVVQENYVDAEPLKLLADDEVPADCNLLIIAGPQGRFSQVELQKIDRYLSEGGRAFVLLDYASISQPTGLENVLARWGVNVVADVVRDSKHTTSTSAYDVVIDQFAQHPVVNSLMQTELQMIYPRPAARIDWKNPPADAPQVTELLFSSAASTLVNNPAEPPRSYPLAVAVEQKNVSGVVNPRGSMRMVVAGDSIFLDNQVIEAGGNRDFLGNAVNWLLDRPAMLQGIGPRPVTTFRLTLDNTQRTEVDWLLLGALPGAVLLLGGLVWFARRK